VSAAAKGHPMGLFYVAVFAVMHAQPLPDDPVSDEKVALHYVVWLSLNGRVCVCGLNGSKTQSRFDKCTAYSLFKQIKHFFSNYLSLSLVLLLVCLCIIFFLFLFTFTSHICITNPSFGGAEGRC